MERKSSTKRVAVLVTDGFEETEFTTPVAVMKDVGIEVQVIGLKPGKVKAWSKGNWSNEYGTDKTIDKAMATDYDALLLPGGLMCADQLRMNGSAVKFVEAFLNKEKPVGAICHAPWLLIETGMIEGRALTSYPSLKTDLMNAGAEWTDEEVVTNGGLITSRRPDDLPAFCEKLLEEIAGRVRQKA